MQTTTAKRKRATPEETLEKHLAAAAAAQLQVHLRNLNTDTQGKKFAWALRNLANLVRNTPDDAPKHLVAMKAAAEKAVGPLRAYLREYGDSFQTLPDGVPDDTGYETSDVDPEC